MAKPDRRADLDQSGRLGCCGRVRLRCRVARLRATTALRRRRGSAAAVSSSRRVSTGRGASRRRKPCSMRLASGIVFGGPNPNASSAGVSPWGNSSRRKWIAAGFGDDPVTHRGSTGPLMTESNNVRASLSLRPLTVSSGSRANSDSSLGSRTANSRATRSARSRRATNANVWAETRSSHCASSTRQTSGCRQRLRHQAEHCKPDQEPVGRVAGAQAERGSQRSPPAGREGDRGGLAAARTAGGVRRRRAPSRPRSRPLGRRDTLTRVLAHTPITPSCRSLPLHAGPAPRSVRREHQPPADPTPHTRWPTTQSRRLGMSRGHGRLDLSPPAYRLATSPVDAQEPN